jgi:hypothetical protein
LLIGTWNVDIADTNGSNRNTAAFRAVMAAMGQEDTYASPQAPDILTVTEVRSNAVSGSQNDTEWLTQQMNAVYGAGVYTHPTQDAASSGGGTEGVIYNTQTVGLLQVQFVGTVSSSGTVRQEYRYRFRPAAVADGSADFYVYVGHYKAGTMDSDMSRRNVEAQQVRANANALGPGVPIVFTGDFNVSGSNEPMAQTLMAPGNGQAFDPVDRPGTWSYNPDFVDLANIASTALNGRLDQLWESGPVRGSAGGYGLKDMPATYHSLGNNGSVPYNSAVTHPRNTALADLPNRLTVLNDLTICSDHIPVLQDYEIVRPGVASHLAVVPDTGAAVAGAPFGVTVEALDANNQVVGGYVGTVHFSSADPYGASLPADYTFQPGDGGVQSFAGGAALYTAGTWDVSATDDGGLAGSAAVTVTAAPAVSFAIGVPASVSPGVPFSITVSALDPYGNVDTNYVTDPSAAVTFFTTTDPDPGVVLPADYQFAPADGGVHAFDGVVYVTPGDQDLNATDTFSGLSGSATVSVSAPPRPRGPEGVGAWPALVSATAPPSSGVIEAVLLPPAERQAPYHLAGADVATEASVSRWPTPARVHDAAWLHLLDLDVTEEEVFHLAVRER